MGIVEHTPDAGVVRGREDWFEHWGVYAVPGWAPREGSISYAELAHAREGQSHLHLSPLGGALPRGQWNHVLLTVDRRHDAQRVYVNGKDITRTDHIGHREFTSKGPVLLGADTSDKSQ